LVGGMIVLIDAACWHGALNRGPCKNYCGENEEALFNVNLINVRFNACIETYAYIGSPKEILAEAVLCVS